MSNIHPRAVKAFGEEWSKFHHAERENPDLKALFKAYFSIFPGTSCHRKRRASTSDAVLAAGPTLSPQKLGLHSIDASAEALILPVKIPRCIQTAFSIAHLKMRCLL